MPHHIVRTITIAGVLGLCAMLAPAAASALPAGGISGTVTDAETSCPDHRRQSLRVRNGVRKIGRMRRTEAGGKYTIAMLTEGSHYKVRFTASQLRDPVV